MLLCPLMIVLEELQNGLSITLVAVDDDHPELGGTTKSTYSPIHHSSLLSNATHTFQLHPTAPALFDLYSFLTWRHLTHHAVRYEFMH
jgi:hypothetical protein